MTTREQWTADELTETLKNVAETDRDNLVGIDGLTGTGKSTLAIKLCKKGCDWFSMKNDILYSRKEIIEWVTNSKQGSWGIADEMINAMFKRDFAAKNQKFLLKVFDMCRDRNLTLFMCIPNFWALDKHLLDGRIRLRIHVAKTGFAFLWRPTTNPFTKDRWYRGYNEVVASNWDVYPNAKRTKGFTGYLKFGDIGSREKEEYLQIKAEKKAMIKAEEEAEEKKEILENKKSMELGKMLVLNWLHNRGLLKPGWQIALASEEGITQQAVSKRFKEFKKDESIAREQYNTNNSNTVYNTNNDNGSSQQN